MAGCISRHIFKRLNHFNSASKRFLHCECVDLKTVVQNKIPFERTRIQEFREEYGSKKIGDITVDMVYGGMRGLKGLVWETSLLDPEEGIRFRGFSIDDCRRLLPKAPGGSQPLPEGLFWLLMTGEIPTESQVKALSQQLAERAHLPLYIIRLLDNIPPEVHPMTQLSCAITALNSNSKFVKAFFNNTNKLKYWEYVYEDVMDIIAKVPVIASIIYSNTYKGKRSIGTIDMDKDWSANFATMLGYSGSDFAEMLRLYLTIHSDHEGGNVSAHAVHLVGSALSDPYLAFAAGINGLAGPLHGLANQNMVKFLDDLQEYIGDNSSDLCIQRYIWETVKLGNVIPGFGHAVLRKTDPRFTCQREFALKYLPDDRMFHLVSKLSEIVPPILLDTGKVKNPWPNVDAHSGVLLQHYGLTEVDFYTVLFAVSRSLGVLAQLVWSRALGFPIERPKSMTTNELMKLIHTYKN